jgi:hypothetical protein
MEGPAWVTLTDEQLLEKKISQLGLKLEGSELEPLIRQLYQELSDKGLAFHPPCHVGDEWSGNWSASSCWRWKVKARTGS